MKEIIEKQEIIDLYLNGEQDFAYNSYWVYSDKHYSGNYSIPKEKPDKYLIPIISIHEQTTTNYQNIYEASNEIGCYPCDIYRVLKGDRKTIKGYKFIYNQ